MFFSPTPSRSRRLQLRFSERKFLLALGDIIAVVISVLIALFVWSLADPARTFSLEFILSESVWFVVLAGLWLLLARANDFYDLRVASSLRKTLRRLLTITAQTWIVYLLVFFVISTRDALPRLFILYYGVASVILIGLWRVWRPALLGWASQPRRTLIVGTDWSAETIIDTMRDFAGDEYDLRGLIGSSEEVGRVIGGVPVLGSAADLMNFVHRDRISELIITKTHSLSGEMFQAIMDAYEQGITVIPMPLLYENITGRVPVEHVDNDWAVVFLPIQTNGSFDPYPFLKRFIDLSLALVGLSAFLITFPFIALAVLLDSRGGIFYAQKRVGLNGCTFSMYKYRSMVADAEAVTGAVFSERGDPRVTRVGRFLRKTRLDELPQVLNILRGDMSVIGPRPERPEHVHRLTQKIPFYRTRLIVRPGLTGWAQVRYDYGSTDEDALIKLQYDLYYIRHSSLLLDVNIILRTVGKVVTMSGV
ncbi:MAG: sugar transferase [Chloroflexi bacterium]|nr:sugar transferase [Chloroflexota bacterium]